jgi:hypothetical protein
MGLYSDMRGDVQLRHCLVDGELRSVSVFSDLPPQLRPHCFCPICKGQVVLKLGESGKMIHHAAHKPGDGTGCYLSAPEGALHFNTKMFIAEQLRKGKRLLVQQKCASQSYRWPCESYLPKLWQSDWDQIEVEYRMASTRPDIVLLKSGNPVAAIEVCVSHEIDELKVEKLKQLDISWLEVKADGSVFDQRSAHCDIEEISNGIGWDINKPLAYKRISPMSEPWTCWKCLNEAKQRNKERARAQIRETNRMPHLERQRRETAERKNLYLDSANNRILGARAIEFTSFQGKRRRYDLFVAERYADGSAEPAEVYIKNGKYGADIILSQEPADEEGKYRLNAGFRDWLNDMRKNSLAVKEHTQGWVTETEFERAIAELDSPLAELMKNLDRSSRNKPQK